MVGTAGPVLAGAAFSNFTHTGTYPVPSILRQFLLGFTQRNFPFSYSELASLEVQSELGNGWSTSLKYYHLHASRLLSSNSINGVPDGFLPDGVQKFLPADSRFGFVLYATPSVWSIYNAGIVSLQKGFAPLQLSG
jgi:hypothetical protein